MTPLEAALAYAERGWPVLALHNPTEAGCSCREPDCSSPAKHPRLRHGVHDASSDPEMVRGWFERWPRANVGIRTGAVSGLVVVDVDPAHGGLETLDRATPIIGELASGARVATGGGGAHLYFRHPGHRVINDVGRRIGPGIDVRGDGGYVVAPPSTHASGLRYRWSGGMDVTEDLPASLDKTFMDRVVVPGRMRYHVAESVFPTSAWAEAAKRGEVASVQAAPEGTRNSTLNRAAFRLGQLVGSGLLEETAVWAELEHASAVAGLAERERQRTIGSGITAGRAAPRWPGDSDRFAEIDGPELGL